MAENTKRTRVIPLIIQVMIHKIAAQTIGSQFPRVPILKVGKWIQEPGRWQNKCIHYLAPHAASEWCELNIQPGDLQSIDIAAEMTTTGSCAPLLPSTIQASASGKITIGTEVLTQMIQQMDAWHLVQIRTQIKDSLFNTHCRTIHNVFHS